MPYISNSCYSNPKLLFNGHFQTIIPALFRKISQIDYTRERITTPDNDFLDLDWSFAQNIKSKQLVILTHGLEGNSNSKYILGMNKAFNDVSIDTLSWNMRSCSGEMNKQLRFYHSGATDDLELVIEHASKQYDEIFLIGFSLGGNLMLKYLGTKSNLILDTKISKAAAFSVPCHLASSAETLAKKSNKIYLKRFLKSLKNKIKEKSILLPNELNIDNIENIKDFFEFDDRYTAPIHGFENANDYYFKNSSIHVLSQISIPTLLINAQNDPFLDTECFPFEQAFDSDKFYFEAPLHGGHCGFSLSNSDINWAEKRAIEFLLY